MKCSALLLGAIALITTSGCMQDTAITTSSPPVNHATTAPPTQPSIKMVQAPFLADGTYQGMIYQHMATLVIKNGRPVWYTWGSGYQTKDLTLRRNNIIWVQDASLLVTAITATGFDFEWRLNSRETTGSMIRQ